MGNGRSSKPCSRPDRRGPDATPRPLVREGDGREARVTPFELFFDLVYVFAVTQLSHQLLTHLDVHGAAQTLLLLLAVWGAWIYTAWATNWVDPDHPAFRLVLIAVMGLSLVMSAALPEAFGTRGLLFAVVYVSIQVGRSAFVLYAVRDRPQLRRNFERILAWQVAAGVLWLAGGMAAGPTRELLWLVAVVLDYAGPVVAFWTPWLGRSRTSEWTIAGGLFSERCQLFVIIALGESILVTGATLGDEALTLARIGAFIVAFAGSVALWWLYFDRAAAFGASVIASTADPGRLGRSAYTYFHIPIVAGIIVSAVGDELAIAHPEGAADAATTAVLILGPALFLVGHALYKWALSGHLYLSRLAAIAALGALAPLGAVAPTVAVSTAAALVVIAVAAYDTWALRRETDHIAAMVEEPPL